MKLNADFSKRAVVHAAQAPWLDSPMAGVQRRMLDRIGEEVARATTIVRYAPKSHFSPHVHGGGEEFLVLEGVFEDEHGAYPAGSYIRNPPQSSHTPGSEEGCVILVKLWQFDLDDRKGVRLAPDDITFYELAGRPGVRRSLLHEDEREQVFLEQWAPGATIEWEGHDGLEVFVTKGSFQEREESFSYQSWLRLPPGEPLSALVGDKGAQVWIKAGHLRIPPTAPQV